MIYTQQGNQPEPQPETQQTESVESQPEPKVDQTPNITQETQPVQQNDSIRNNQRQDLKGTFDYANINKEDKLQLLKMRL